MFTSPAVRRGPEALLHAFMELQRKIDGQKLTGAGKADHLQAGAAERVSGAGTSARTISSRRRIPICSSPQPVERV